MLIRMMDQEEKEEHFLEDFLLRLILFSLSLTGVAFKEKVDLKTFLLIPCARRRATTF